jgi:hypothetical protein
LRKIIISIGINLGVIVLVGSVFPVFADDTMVDESMTPEQIEAWFNDDLEERALAVNEGKLEFLSQIPDKPAHHSHNTFILDDNSLQTGWVELNQCHSQLDAVPEAQIVYRYQRMKKLRIESYSGIRRAWVEGDSVQLEDIQPDASLCISAEVRILYSSPDGSFILKNGPFHRKFLDGYYPMQVTLTVQYPDEFIRFTSISPQIQPGLTVSEQKGKIEINVWFEGELTTEIRFTPNISRE